MTLADSTMADNDVLVAEVYPDSSDSTDRVTLAYNRQSEIVRIQDQNGTVHEIARDGLGRQTSDGVPALGLGVDGAVRRIDTTYEVRGMVSSLTSYDSSAGGSVVNQVGLAYNEFRQLVSDAQAHSGSVGLGTPSVGYSFVNGAGNTIRPTGMTYPNGNALGFGYGMAGSPSDKLSRVEQISFNSAGVANYTYLGLGDVVNVNYPQPGVTMALNDGAGNYPGLDIFGRVVDVPWSKSAPGDLVRLRYGYDRASNRTFRADQAAKDAGKAFDEKYENDPLDRLVKFHRGTLVAGVITNPGLQQGWQLDATGNWQNFTQFDPANSLNTLDQQRTSNAANEIVDIERTVGNTWATPAYDRAGNMVKIPQPNAPAQLYAAVFDAWQRLTQLADPATRQIVQQNQYDGRNFRIVRKTFSAGVLSETRDIYYSASWQSLEERVSGSPERQHVWGLRYIDDLILRDRSNGGVLNERLYAMQDANWNMVAICDVVGVVQERYVYTAYGVCQFLNGSFAPIAGSAFDWNVLYTSRALDLQSGLYYYRLRYYQPVLGIFVSRDLLGALPHLYHYCRNCPTGKTDPTGLDTSILITGTSQDGSITTAYTSSWENSQGFSSTAPSAQARASTSVDFDLLHEIQQRLPTKVQPLYFDARIAVIPLAPPAGTIEVVLFIQGDVSKCCAGNGRTGLYFHGSVGAEVSGGIGTSIGGNSGIVHGKRNWGRPRKDKQPNASTGRTYYYEKGTGRMYGTTPPVVGAKDYGERAITRTKITGEAAVAIPPCPTKLSGDASGRVGISGFASVGVGRLSAGAQFDLPVGEISLSNGIHFVVDQSSAGVVYGLGTGARIQVYGRASGELTIPIQN